MFVSGSIRRQMRKGSDIHMSEFEDMVRQIPGIDDLIASGILKIDTSVPLSMDELEFLPDIDMLDQDELESLLSQLEELLDDLEEEEPDEDSEAHEEWEESIDEVTDLIDEVQSRIEDLDDEEEE